MSLPQDPSQTLLDHSTLTQGTLLWLCTMYKLHIAMYKAWFSLLPIYLVYFGLTNTNLDTLLHNGDKSGGTAFQNNLFISSYQWTRKRMIRNT
jgi:hypothetical protein